MKIAVFGAKGRVGSRLVALARQKGHQVSEIDLGTVTDDITADVAVDFSTADATDSVCDFCEKHNCPLVSGTTGRNALQQNRLQRTKSVVEVVESANFSKGITILDKICQLLAPLGWDCDVMEIHRKGKRDRPSGTAKQLAHTLLVGGARDVTVHSIRSGSNFGTHTVVFGTDGESLTLTHRAENADVFAIGALEIAEKLFAAQHANNSK